MATTFKSFSSNDVISTKTLLHEAVPVTGQICSGTYADGNIKNYSHGQFQSVYDYPYLSSSANHIFDIAIGYSAKSYLSGASNVVAQKKKINLYNQMAQVLMGFDHTGAVHEFDEDGDLLAGGTKVNSAYFINLSRLLVKDEIKKGSFSLDLGVGSDSPNKASSNCFSKIVRLSDTNAQNDYRVNSPAGEYGILYAAVNTVGSVNTNVLAGDPAAGATTVKAGLIYYQAGIVVITSSIFIRAVADSNAEPKGGLLHASLGAPLTMSKNADGLKGYNSSTPETAHHLMTGSNITASCDGIRSRIFNMSFNNTTELNSTVYFCRANHNEFNYSANPTYLEASKLRVKQQSTDTPVSFITTVGLYSADNELMAVAKLSEPLRKDPTNEMTLRVRLDY